MKNNTEPLIAIGKSAQSGQSYFAKHAVDMQRASERESPETLYKKRPCENRLRLSIEPQYKQFMEQGPSVQLAGQASSRYETDSDSQIDSPSRR